MIPAPTNKSKKNDTTSKSHVSEATAPNSILPPILEESFSLSGEFKALNELVKDFTSRLDSLSAKVEQFSNRLTSCELNHDAVVQKKYNYKKDVHDFLGTRTPSYMNSSNLPSPSHYHDVTMSF